MAPSLGKDVEQHNFLGYDTEISGLSKEGQVLVGVSGNILANGVKSSLEGSELPGIRELVCGGNAAAERLFDRLVENGMAAYGQMVADSRRKHRAVCCGGR